MPIPETSQEATGTNHSKAINKEPDGSVGSIASGTSAGLAAGAAIGLASVVGALVSGGAVELIHEKEEK